MAAGGPERWRGAARRKRDEPRLTVGEPGLVVELVGRARRCGPDRIGRWPERQSFVVSPPVSDDSTAFVAFSATATGACLLPPPRPTWASSRIRSDMCG